MNRTWKAAAIVAALIGLAAAERALERTAIAQHAKAPVFQVEPVLAEDAGVVDPRTGLRHRRRRTGSRLADSASVVTEQRREGGKPRSEMLPVSAAGHGIRRLRTLHAGMGRRRVLATNGRTTSTASTSITKTTSGSRRPAARASPRHRKQILKFTRDGKFLFQVGHRGQSKGSLDTANFNNAADIYVYPKTNEAFVADGYVNRRVIVLDADTGAFKRMWGAYGNPPDDAAPTSCRRGAGPHSSIGARHPRLERRPGRRADRINDRLPLFVDGNFQHEIFVERKTSCSAPRSRSRSHPTPRSSISIWPMPATGRSNLRSQNDAKGGQFRADRSLRRPVHLLHNVAVDSQGNLYTAEVGTGRRVQKFLAREIEAIEIHDLVPRGDEVAHELRPRVVAHRPPRGHAARSSSRRPGRRGCRST